MCNITALCQFERITSYEQLNSALCQYILITYRSLSDWSSHNLNKKCLYFNIPRTHRYEYFSSLHKRKINSAQIACFVKVNKNLAIRQTVYIQQLKSAGYENFKIFRKKQSKNSCFLLSENK